MSEWAILGCGYVGTRLGRALLGAGHRVRACARSGERLAALAEAGAEVHAFDGAERSAFAPALAGLRAPMVVYSIPPIAGAPAGDPLRRAGEAAIACGARRFLYLGSTAVYGETPDGETVDEESPVAASDPEALPRLADEAAVEALRRAGLSTVLLRLAAIYGPGRGVRERLRAGRYQLVDGGAHWFSRVHVDDLVAIVEAAAERAPRGALYCVADDRPSTQREVVEWLTRRLGLALPSSAPALPRGAPRHTARGRKVSNARLKRELDYRFRYPSFVEGERAIEEEELEAARGRS